MSGGSWDYVYRRIADAGERLALHADPTRRAMAPHLARLADAMKAIEWHDSGDWGPEHEEPAVRAFLDGCGGADLARLEVLRVDAERLVAELRDALAKAAHPMLTVERDP
jgi:hypothetical protein